jgi:hypothetical protein
VVSFTPFSLYPQWNRSRYTFYRRLSGPQNQSGPSEEQKTSRPCQESNTGSPVVTLYPNVTYRIRKITLHELRTESRSSVFRPESGTVACPNSRGLWVSSALVAALHAGVRTAWPISCLPPNDLSSDSWFNYEDARDRTGRERQKKNRGNTAKIMAWGTRAKEWDGWKRRSRR